MKQPTIYDLKALVGEFLLMWGAFETALIGAINHQVPESNQIACSRPIAEKLERWRWRYRSESDSAVTPYLDEHFESIRSLRNLVAHGIVAAKWVQPDEPTLLCDERRASTGSGACAVKSFSFSRLEAYTTALTQCGLEIIAPLPRKVRENFWQRYTQDEGA